MYNSTLDVALKETLDDGTSDEVKVDHMVPNTKFFRSEEQKTPARAKAETKQAVRVALTRLYVNSKGNKDAHGHRVHGGLTHDCQLWLSYWTCFPLLESLNGWAVPHFSQRFPELPRIFFVVLVWMQVWGVSVHPRKLVRLIFLKAATLAVREFPETLTKDQQPSVSHLFEPWMTAPFTFGKPYTVSNNGITKELIRLWTKLQKPRAQGGLGSTPVAGCKYAHTIRQIKPSA